MTLAASNGAPSGGVLPDSGFSVVIPVFNRAKALRRAVSSVLEQTHPELELIVVDDGSTDGSAEVASSFGDPRVRVMWNHGKKGAANARNVGIEAASKPLVAFLDSDDAWLPTKLSVTLASINRRRLSGSWVLFNRVRVEQESCSQLSSTARPGQGQPVSEFLFLTRGYIQTSAVTLPAPLAKAVRFDPGLPRLQDWDFYLRLERAGAQFFFEEEPLTIYDGRASPQRISSNVDPDFLARWLDERRSMLSDRSIHAFRLFKLVPELVQSGRRGAALAYLLQATILARPNPSHALIELCRTALPSDYFLRLTALKARLSMRGSGVQQ